VRDLRQAIREEKREAARKLAHKLSGSLGMFGFEWASTTCKAIEKAAPTDALSSLDNMAELVARHMDHVEVKFVMPAENVVDFQI